MLWALYFREAQGYTVKKNELLQDNQSAIKLEENGRADSSKHTKHIHIWYFFIKDKIENGVVCIKYCLTTKMWANRLTKPQ